MRLARQSRDPDQTRRLLALAEIYAGGSRSDAAWIGGVELQIMRDWVLRFNAKGPDGFLNGKALGAPSILDGSQRQALRQVVEDGPIPAAHGVVRWRLIERKAIVEAEGGAGLGLRPLSMMAHERASCMVLGAQPCQNGQVEPI